MYCTKCGAELPPDSQFCTVCGAKLENPAAPNVEPIAPPAMDQPFAYGQPPKKKNKALFWTLIGVGMVFIVAAVLVFVFFASGTAGPFSGNTVQTRFANDVVGVFTGTVSGLETQNDIKKIAVEPFELTMSNSIDMSGVKTDMDISYAYDQKTFGLNSTSAADYSNSEYSDLLGDQATMENTIKALLVEDTLYIDVDGNVTGIKFDSKADLSKAMSLKDRISALFENNKLKEIDFLKLTELFLNSIDESCFDKSAGENTLTLNGKELADTLDTFADKLKDNKELNDAINEMIEEASGYPLDLSSAISLAAPMLEEADFELIMNVSYGNGRPTGLEIAFEEADSEVFDVAFEYENIKDGKVLTLNVSTPDGQVLSLDLNITKTTNGADFDGTISVPGSDDITISGSEEIAGDSITGTIEISMGDQKITMNIDETVKIGMPSEAVENDSRFAIDTTNANMVNLNEIFNLGANQDTSSQAD